jgi:hypothetical protein
MAKSLKTAVERLIATPPEGVSPPPPLNVIRTEHVLSRFPAHNLSKKGKIDIEIVKRNAQGEIEIRWEVTYNDRYGQARQMAYKLDTLVINRRIEEQGRPIPKLIRLGSLRDIATELGMGGNTSVIKRALRQNASAFITVKVRYTNIEGIEKTLEADFTRYSVIFTGERLPDKRRADCVYISLNDVYWSMLNDAPFRPQDYEYLKSLTPSAQRFYEIMGVKFYNAFRFNNPNASRITYSEYCSYSAQQRYFDYEHFKKQMYKVHQPHKQSGYLAGVSYEAMLDGEGRPDWMMLYVPGPKARNEYDFFMGKPGLLEESTEIFAECTPDVTAGVVADPAPSSGLGEYDQEIIAAMLKRGISEKQAQALLGEVREGQAVLEQLEYADYRIACEPLGTFRNPPGFSISVIRDNTPVPESFETSRKRAERVEQEGRLEQECRRRLELEVSYERYKRELVEQYIREELTAVEHDALIEQHKKNYLAQFRNATHWSVESLHSVATSAAASDIAKRVPVQPFEEFCRGL